MHLDWRASVISMIPVMILIGSLFPVMMIPSDVNFRSCTICVSYRTRFLYDTANRSFLPGIGATTPSMCTSCQTYVHGANTPEKTSVTMSDIR